jgi:serine/threonine protein kinase
MIHAAVRDSGLTSGSLKLKPTMREATSRSGVSVVLKTIFTSNERELLQYFNGFKESPKNHTIPLLEVIDLSVGNTIIVLPWKSPLDNVLGHSTHPDTVSLCRQFVEGVAFLHQHKVAHCDLKPGNVVVDTNAEKLPRLFIIDFDLALRVESEESMTEGWCGTPPWIAPEVGTRDGPICRYNPILADRWACGLMINYFAKYFPANEDAQQSMLLSLSKRLLNREPRKRPELELPAAINRSTMRRKLPSQRHGGGMLRRSAVCL